MRYFMVLMLTLALLLFFITGCGKVNWQEKADAFLAKYLDEYAKLELVYTTISWKASNTGAAEDFAASATAEIDLRKLHSDPQRYKELTDILAHAGELQPLTLRSLKVAELAFKGNQLSPEMIEKLSKGASDIQQTFNTFRGKIDGQEYSNNELLEMLAKSTDSAERQKTWEALKQTGEAVAPKLIALAKVRNEAAVTLGFKNYWDMQVRLQEHDPDQLVAIFAELEKTTDEPFRQMKAKLDSEIAPKFKVKAEAMMPWHYDNPFFQDAPPSDKLNLDDFYKDKPKEEIIQLAQKLYGDIDLQTGDIVSRSDLYERPGKDQHAFSTSIDRKGDCRILVNIKPTAEWMDTCLHELGHAVYSKYHDFTMPFNLRDAAHAFTTEGIAQLFGALSKNPTWIVAYAGIDPEKVKLAEGNILEQRRREQLIFARWGLVMLNFEKALYENPDQDLNKLWYDYVERFQLLTRPQDRNLADWAAKPHFTIAPVYYHNYILGELFAAQLRATLVKLANHQGPTFTMNYGAHKEFGDFLKKKVFEPGASYAWPEFVKNATGEPLTAQYFAGELK